MMSDFKQRATIAAAVNLGCLSPEDAAALRAERDAALANRVVSMPANTDEAASMALIGMSWLQANAPEKLTEVKQINDSEVAARAVDEFMSKAAYELANSYESGTPISQWETGMNSMLAMFVRYSVKYIAQLRAGARQ